MGSILVQNFWTICWRSLPTTYHLWIPILFLTKFFALVRVDMGEQKPTFFLRTTLDWVHFDELMEHQNPIFFFFFFFFFFVFLICPCEKKNCAGLPPHKANFNFIFFDFLTHAFFHSQWLSFPAAKGKFSVYIFGLNA